MYNIQSHVREHGHETMEQRPFDVLDGLAMTQLVYMPMEGLIDDGGETTVRELWYFLSLRYLDAFPTFYPKKCYFFTQSCAASKRFAPLMISDYVNHIDPNQELQFCACTFALPDGSHFISFRGTDMSLVGWKEDLNMSFMTVPAQRMAVDYVAHAAEAHEGPLYLGGHSKGGNLALYAASHSEPAVRARIAQAYSFDGQGVDKATLDSEGYQDIKDRVQSWIPQSSVVGMLLCYHPNYFVVKSTALGLLQHDAFTWQIKNGAFEQLPELNITSRVSAEAFRKWLDQYSEDDRRFMAEVIIQIVSGIGTDTIAPLYQDLRGSSLKMFSAFNKLDFETRARATLLFTSLLSTEAGYAMRKLIANVLRVPSERTDEQTPDPQPDNAADTPAGPQPTN